MKSEFGQRLIEARKYAKLTQVQLSKAVGATQASISGLEMAGKGSALTPAIAEKCGVSVNWLAYGIGEMLAKNQKQPNTESVTAACSIKGAEPAMDHSPQANELALLFDMLTDRVERTVAFNGATEAILKVLSTRTG
jgi:transcriptional regulator with XRE-family HTH domain